jgi:hypothetical protein
MAWREDISSGLGILEFWSGGVLTKAKIPNFNLNWFFHCSITPSLQQTAARGTRPLKPLRG